MIRAGKGQHLKPANSLTAAMGALALMAASAPPSTASSGDGAVVIDLDTTGHQPTFRPDEALGAAFDGAERGDIDRLLTRHNVEAMKSAGLRPLSYRLRTELGIEVWHWNPAGQWSDPGGKQGYWTSSDRLGAPIALSWGYRLPRRGDTVDNATNDEYSRLTDGDHGTFWKSNPYLDPAVLHDGREHPQWLLVGLGKPQPVDTARIDWGTPFAVSYEVQYWTGATDYDAQGRWQTFHHGAVTTGNGGEVNLRLADQPVSATYIRILLRKASGTAPAGANDWRDRLGYAVREVSFGRTAPNGAFTDAVVHAPSHDHQTFAHVSSTDPWHRAVDRNPNLEQAGIDRIFATGLGFGLPVMMPTGALYDTPENVAAELRYIARRGYPVKQVELGEEPDGQYGSPEDYGALYLMMLDRAKAMMPGVVFGGPSLQSGSSDLWLQDKSGSWNAGFVDYLKGQGRLGDLGFVSFEYYPFDDICGDIHAKLIEQTGMMDDIAQRFDSDGVPRSVPRIITEYGFSAYSGRAMSEMPSALLMAGIVGQWLHLGGDAAYMFGYGPATPVNQHLPCAGYGNMMLQMADARGQATTPMPSFYTARLLTQVWTLPGHGLHRMVDANIRGGGLAPDVVAYAVERPDHRIAVLLINRSAGLTHRASLMVKGTANPLQGAVDLYSYGAAQYAWRDAGERSRPLRSLPPAHRLQDATAPIVMAPASLVVAVLPAPAKR